MESTVPMKRPRTASDRTSFGTAFDLLEFEQLLALIGSAVTSRRRCIVGYTNLHAAYLQARTDLSKFYGQADSVYADGFPLVLWRKILWRDCTFKHRFTLSQELPKFLDQCVRHKWRVFYIGSEYEVVRDAQLLLKAQHPELEIDVHHGFFNKQSNARENMQVIDQINSSCPAAQVDKQFRP